MPMQLIAQLKAADQDHEFYPTTREIIDALIHDMLEHGAGSVLDIGAGNGKVLQALSDAPDLHVGPLYAIEKSTLLQQQINAAIPIIGTEFAEQSLFSKPVDTIFCNPPYSQFETWVVKIIREAAAQSIYLVIPRRWQDSVRIQDALRYRGVLMPGEPDPNEAKRWAEASDEDWRRWRSSPTNYAHILGEFDFEDAEDRRARAKVHLLRIDLAHTKHELEEHNDPFERFFNEQFAGLIAKFKDQKPGSTEPPPEKPQRFPLTVGGDYIETLVGLYLAEMANIERNYRLVAELDAELLREFEISPARIMACLKQRLSGLKNDYWQELFAKLNKITDRLTSKSRENLLKTLQAYISVDFTVSNIHAVVLWVLKNVNHYLTSQLLSLYDLMVDKCNAQMYTSNLRTWHDEGWRYNTPKRGKNTHFKLDYRIVMHSVGGLSTHEYDWDKRGNNHLKGECFTFLQDLLTIANNLGFITSTHPYTLQRNAFTWHSNKLETFYYTNVSTHKQEILFDARAFKNGNLHLRLNQRFILALNVEHGRLRGWIRTGEEAAAELGDIEAVRFFNTHLQLPTTTQNPALLLVA